MRTEAVSCHRHSASDTSLRRCMGVTGIYTKGFLASGGCSSLLYVYTDISSGWDLSWAVSYNILCQILSLAGTFMVNGQTPKGLSLGMLDLCL
jgi:hypothetical protein